MSPFELGLALLTGRASKAWASRAIRARALLAGAVGGAPPGCEGAPPGPRSPGPDRLHMKAHPAARAQAVEGARNLVDALGRRRLDRLGELLAPEVWVLWPNGNLLLHPKGALLAELEKRPGERLPIKITDPKSYGYAELRTALARGIAEGCDAVLDLEDATAVTLQVAGGRGPPGRVLVAMASLEGAWRARSLPLGGPDDVHVISGRMKDRDPNAGAVLGPVLRALILGHAGHLKASLQHLMPRLWLHDRVLEAAALAELAAEGDHRLGAGELVFGRLKEVELKKLQTVSPKPGLAQLEAKAFETFGERWPALSPTLWSMEMAAYDPATGKLQPGAPVHGLMVRVEDGAGRPRPKVAGIYL